jgi:hypothetical protein
MGRIQTQQFLRERESVIPQHKLSMGDGQLTTKQRPPIECEAERCLMPNGHKQHFPDVNDGE